MSSRGAWKGGTPKAVSGGQGSPDLSLEESHDVQGDEESQKLQGEGEACAKAQRDEVPTTYQVRSMRTEALSAPR